MRVLGTALAMPLGVTAFAADSVPQSLPLQHGMLHVSGASVGAAATDACEVIVDDGAELSVMLLDVDCADANRVELRAAALRVVIDTVNARAPIYEIVSALRAFAAGERKLSVGIILLRFSQPKGRVEILNAGMPAVACVLPDGRIALHAALSPAIGRRLGDVHPYELAPLIWGSSWLAVSDGLSAGQCTPDEVCSWLSGHALLQRGPELAGETPAALSALISELAPAEENPGFGDASLRVVHSDSTRRFRSGIQP